MKTIHDRINREHIQLMTILDVEKKVIDYEKRWEDLRLFRNRMADYVEGYNTDITSDLSSKVVVLENGHIIDHHALGYFAPMHFKRYGFVDKTSNLTNKITPVNQITTLAEFLNRNNVRFIYVPLPCKGAVYPEIIVESDFIPDDGMIIPQWRNMLYELALNNIELVDCYNELCNVKKTFTKNHHISPLGAQIVGKKIAGYIMKTTEFTASEDFKSKENILGSPTLMRSGDNNSVEMGMDYFDTESHYYRISDKYVPFSGRNIRSEIAIIGDCNLQAYRGTGSDLTAQISGNLRYPIKYLGRYLPFAKKDSIEKLPKGTLKGVKILLYVGFISACFVRACREDDSWSTHLPDENIFSC